MNSSRTLSVIFSWIALTTSVAQASTTLQKNVVVSDVDDTFKITNVGSVWDAIKNGLFSRKAFAGMSSFYREQRYPTVFVSGSIRPLRGILDDFFESHKISRYRLFLRDTYLENVRKYKVETISRLLPHLKPGVKAVLIGDDTESDPESFLDLKRAFPEQIAAIYIRSIRNRVIPEGQVAFTSALELALRENNADRFSKEATRAVLGEFLESPADETIFPDFAHCPDRIEWSKLSSDENEAAAIRALEARLELYCQRRNSTSKDVEVPTDAPADITNQVF